MASFLTMTLVMEFGRSAETEAVFSLFVAASMLLWHWGWVKKWPDWQMWSVGYACTALGMLTKGLQAPLYFVGAGSPVPAGDEKLASHFHMGTCGRNRGLRPWQWVPGKVRLPGTVAWKIAGISTLEMWPDVLLIETGPSFWGISSPSPSNSCL